MHEEISLDSLEREINDLEKRLHETRSRLNSAAGQQDGVVVSSRLSLSGMNSLAHTTKDLSQDR